MIPQGSVLRPILWIIGYDAMLRRPLPPDTGMVCYADVSPGWRTLAAVSRHCVSASSPSLAQCVQYAGWTLRLSGCLQPSLRLFGFTIGGVGGIGLCLDINGEHVEVGLQMKYPSLTIDSQWTSFVACCRISVGPDCADYTIESSGSCTRLWCW